MFAAKLTIAALVLACSAFDARAGQYLPTVQKTDSVCEEISMSARAPSGCLLKMVSYKGLTCYQCRGADTCKPSCSGGKICSSGKCVCPPNRGLVDCNGVCVGRLQCSGLAKNRRR